jgi:small-conductance mechanosensitive channel
MIRRPALPLALPLALALAALLCFALARVCSAQSPEAAAPATTNTYATVRVEGRKLFDVMGANGLSAADRADRINRRLASLIAQNEPVRPFNRQDITHQGSQTLVTLGGQLIVSVTDSDAQDALLTRDELALLWGGKMALAVSDARASRTNPLRGAGILIRNSVTDLIHSMLAWLPRLAGALLLALLVWLAAKALRGIVSFTVSRTHFDTNTRQLLKALAFYGMWLVGLIAILSTLGLEGTSIATTLGISGFVLGFAFKDILSHFFAGIMLLLGRQFHIGDQIVVKDQEGTVERIELRALYLRTYDNRLVIIPNGDVFTSIVTSNTASPHRRREFVVGIGYGDDIGKACRIGLETMLGTPGVLHDPAPDVLVDELAASTVNLKLRFYMNSTRADYLKVGSECMWRVKEAFDRDGVSMPTDIQTVYIKNFEGLDAGFKPAEGQSPSDGSERPNPEQRAA